MRQIQAADMVQFNMFEMLPRRLIGIQVGCISGQTLQMDVFCGTVCQIGFNVLIAMDRRSIPDD